MKTLEDCLIKAIKERLEVVAREEIEKCKENIHARMGEYVSGTVIQLMQYVSVDRVGHEIMLRVEMPKETK